MDEPVAERPDNAWADRDSLAMHDDLDDSNISGAGLAPPAARHPASTPADGALEAELRQLLQRVMQQDEAALATLYDRLIGRVYGLALRFTRDTGLAEEVAEDVFWQVWRQAPRYDAARGSVGAWVQTLARSRALDALRRRHPLQLEADMTTLADHSEQAAHEAANPQNLLDATQRDRQLHAALVDLDPLPRQLISLAFFRGLTHEEISDQTALPLGTVKSHLRRAIVRLRQLLEPEAQRRGAEQ